jgi:hypothetical protein
MSFLFCDSDDGDGLLLDHSLVLCDSNKRNLSQYLHCDVSRVVEADHREDTTRALSSLFISTVLTDNLLSIISKKVDIYEDYFDNDTERLKT